MPDELKTNRADSMATVSKGLLSLLPYVGGLFAEIVGSLIPNQRTERLMKFMEKLDRKLSQLGKDITQIEQELSTPEGIDLLEDAFQQSARALSDTRLEYLASLLKNSLASEQLEYVKSKQLMSLLAELNDAEVIILGSYEDRGDEYHKKHEEVLQPRQAYIGAPQVQLDESAIYKSYREHMARLGLLRPSFRRPHAGKSPELDHETGMLKAFGYQITRLGRMLLWHIDLTSNP